MRGNTPLTPIIFSKFGKSKPLTPQNVVDATAAMTPEQAAQTMQNLGIPAVSSTDNGKFMKVVDGQWAAVTVPEAAGEEF